jgi:hypothetical protein
MKKNTIVRTVLAGMFALFSSGAIASDTIPVPAGSNAFDFLPVFLPWMGTSNPGALSENSIGNLSLMQAGYMHSDDQIRFIQQPEKTSVYNAETKGFMQLGKLYLFGAFGYSNNRYRGSEYNGTLMFNSLNPYLLGDTVPDLQFKEQFEMEGKASYRLSERLTIATGVEYLSAVGAKQKDPRNKNSISYLRVSPGVIYDLGKTKLGLSGSVYTTSDEISYSVEGNWNQTLFVLLGLGYYRQEVNISYYSEWYTGKGYSGALQASHANNKLYMLGEVKYDHYSEEARTGSSFRLIDGITTTNDISLSGLLRLSRGKALHLLTLKGSFKAVSSDEILQRSITVNKGTYSYDSLATISWIENKHLISDLSGALGYSYIVLDDESNIGFEAGGAVDVTYFSTEHYPVQSYGYYNFFNLKGSLFAGKLLHIGSLNLTPRIDVSYRANLGSDLSYMVQTYSLPEMIYHDYFVSKAGMMSGSLSLKLEKPTPKNKFINSLFMIPEGRYVMAPDTEAGTLTGYMISAVAGIIF